STLNYLLGDHLGSTAITANSSGGFVAEVRYGPWGTTRYTSGTTPTTFRFTGQRQESGLGGPEGLYFYNARWYDPAVGRFVQADTIVPEANNPQSLNRYSYTRNNPIRYIDPTGHCITNSYEQTRDDYFDCSVDELRILDWDVRIWWIGQLAKDAGMEGWFNNIIGVLEFFRDTPVLGEDLNGWASTSDAALLWGIQDGFRQVFRSEGWNAGTTGGKLWANFFRETDESKLGQLWGKAEQAVTKFGIAYADKTVGRPRGFEGVVINTFIGIGDQYRALLAKSGNTSPLYTMGIVDPRDDSFCFGKAAVRCGAEIALMVAVIVAPPEGSLGPAYREECGLYGSCH
ncbi:MAG: RHS repeat-associated core domain-containing protein, partial [Anaerolineae bacterium]|nr:RHS repeat-associated core domain-containing protein [Anaerolineae bacterium]